MFVSLKMTTYPFVFFLLLLLMTVQTTYALSSQPSKQQTIKQQSSSSSSSQSSQSQSSPLPQKVLVRVCQNKHCLKRNPNLLQSICNLSGSSSSLPSNRHQLVDVESSGCLSQCDHGPNMEITITENDSVGKEKKKKKKHEPIIKLVHEVSDSTTAAIHLDMELEKLSSFNNNGNSKEISTIPKLLKAATKVMERAESTKDPNEQIRLLNSVISKLEEDQELFASPSSTSSSTSSSLFSSSTALAHAYALRGRAYVELGDYKSAIANVKHVVDVNENKINHIAVENKQKHEQEQQQRLRKATNLFNAATSHTTFLCYRAWVDSERELLLLNKREKEEENNNNNNNNNKHTINESTGNDDDDDNKSHTDLTRTIAVLQQWNSIQPEYHTKIQNEIQDLMKEHFSP